MKKTIFITGSTDGIGKLAAQKLAKQGHEIILHGRNPEKLKGVVEELKLVSNNDAITGYIADLSDLSATKTMAEKVKDEHDKIDVLINKAGVLLTPNPRNEKQIDVRLLVNYLAPVLITQVLSPSLENAEKPRVINLSSAAQSPVSLDALKGQEVLSDQGAYAQSKLALTMWNVEMAQIHKNIVFIAVNPGSLLNTKMVQEAYGKHWSPAVKGADILVDLSTSNEHDNMSGKYFDNDHGGYGHAHPDARDQSKLWRLSRATEQIVNSI